MQLTKRSRRRVSRRRLVRRRHGARAVRRRRAPSRHSRRRGARRRRAHPGARTMRLRGYGHDPYQDGGSLITTEPTAPEKMTIITAYERVIDLANGRTRVRAKQSRAFVFAAQAMMAGRPIDQALDGDVAFDVAAGGAARRLSKEVATQRRMELLANPIVAVRAALDSRSRVANRRTEGAATLVDVTTAASNTFTLAVTTADGPPALGTVGGAAREPRRHDVSRRVQRLRARRRRVGADELQHGVGLQGQRAAAPARRPLRARRRRRRLGRAGGRALGAGARAGLYGRCERGRAGRVVVVGQRRRQFRSARVRGSLDACSRCRRTARGRRR